MKNWKLWTNIAKLNLVKNRAAQYISIINFIMIGKVFVETFDNRRLGYMLLCAGIAILIIVGFVDYTFVLGKEQEILWNKNKAWHEYVKWQTEKMGYDKK